MRAATFTVRITDKTFRHYSSNLLFTDWAMRIFSGSNSYGTCTYKKCAKCLENSHCKSDEKCSDFTCKKNVKVKLNVEMAPSDSTEAKSNAPKEFELNK